MSLHWDDVRLFLALCRARTLGEAGRKLAEERFALSRTVEDVDQFYTTLLQKKGIR